MTGDRMKMLMLTLPFMIRDRIAPELHDILICPWQMYKVYACIYQPEVILSNRAIDNTKAGSLLADLPHVANPSNEIVVVYSFSGWMGILPLARTYSRVRAA